MKIFKYILFVSVLMSLLGVTSCSKDKDSPSSEEMFLSKLKGEWKLTTGSVKRDGKDVTEYFKSMTVSFDKQKNYTVINPLPPIWPASGKFTLQESNEELFNILRSDGVLMYVTSITDSGLTLKFNYDTSSGRTTTISGEYEFVMNR